MEVELSKLALADRRAQLLEAGMAVVRARGANALSLGLVAREAGVSKPLVYHHFQTREGLLLAIYEMLDQRYIDKTTQGVATIADELPELAAYLGASYLECCEAMGAEYYSIAAALKGDPQLETTQRRMADRLVDLYAEALGRRVDRPADDLRVACLAILGAADNLAQGVMTGRVPKEAAQATLTMLIQQLARGEQLVTPEGEIAE